MSDVEQMTQRNWEQRQHAEAYAARMEQEERERMDREVIRIANREPDEPRSAAGGTEKAKKHMKQNRGWMAKAARAAGRTALVVSAASALAGLELLFPLFGLVAVIFYTLNFELKGRNGLWQKMG